MDRLPFVRISASVAAVLLLTCAVQGADYITEFNGTLSGSVNFSIDRVEVTWSTSVLPGNPVTAADLSNFRLSLYDGNGLVYNDDVIVNGVVQPIGGVSRDLADLTFGATSGVSIQNIDNDYEQRQFAAASGTTFNVYGDATALNLAYFVNGAFQEDPTLTVTSLNTTPVPEPSSYVALAGACCLGVALYRKCRRA